MSQRKTSEFFKTIPVREALKIGPRRFFNEYLIPAMRREHGAGFAMDTWSRDTRISEIQGLDELYDRPTPACHFVMCIGGTMQAITGARSEQTLARILGIPHNYGPNNMDASTLFYNWKNNRGPWRGLSTEFNEAETPQEKERVAEKAIRAAVKFGEKLARQAK